MEKKAQGLEFYSSCFGVGHLEKGEQESFWSVEMSFAQLSSLPSLIFFWTTHVVPMFVEDCVSFIENHIL